MRPSAKLFLLVSFAALVAICAYPEAPATVAQALKRYGVDVNEPALVQALSDTLSDTRKEVRGLSAAGLAGMKFTEALPDIVRAAETEPDGLTQVNIAAAATWLGSEQGLSY